MKSGLRRHFFKYCIFALPIIVWLIFSPPVNFNHRDIDPTDFNEEISNKTNIKTPEDLARALFPDRKEVFADGGEHLTVTTTELVDNVVEIKARIGICDDDELESETYCFVVLHKNGHWKVLRGTYEWTLQDR